MKGYSVARSGAWRAGRKTDISGIWDGERRPLHFRRWTQPSSWSGSLQKLYGLRPATNLLGSVYTYTPVYNSKSGCPWRSFYSHTLPVPRAGASFRGVLTFSTSVHMRKLGRVDLKYDLSYLKFSSSWLLSSTLRHYSSDSLNLKISGQPTCSGNLDFPFALIEL